MLAIHFGGGNIGRGFIGEVLNKNGFKIAFVDVNKEIIDALNDKHEYTIELAQEGTPQLKVNNVYGINNGTHPEEVIAAFEQASIVTTAIGPKILPYIAPLIAKGIQKRRAGKSTQPIDVIACENMIGGSTFLKEEVSKHLVKEDMDYLEQYIGFPDAAVDRIVPLQSHEDKLFVSVEGYKEWVIDESKLKNTELRLEGVHYAPELEPFIERKLFTVNTGHATTAYVGKYEGYKTIDEALKDEKVKKQVENVLAETGAVMVEKWQFNAEEHKAYITKILSRFMNPYISDDITRVARTPMRKLGYDERFIRPIREASERGLETDYLIKTVAKALVYRDSNDEESQQLEKMLEDKSVETVIREVTQLKDETIIGKIASEYELLTK
ncbi:mannitol-1-phosphate 5-dehydrogenase [Carnobacterium sp. 17-4]|uniref:mannitol-1-phosphate 5-dehydrogenase n=1 Tax=Carnobacterium sp. (strain 17-4) TaxID=208596 RepID=UPI0002058A15|nr:mannitol-1-phosphate 5-dehydrogenase [Carnobacterium sp. 17-4]AEB30080.1 mannitol-1-phosphate 5-dehydrogenase [Carnobacterium sp. 17-4]